jgi:hypothetical protein
VLLHTDSIFFFPHPNNFKMTEDHILFRVVDDRDGPAKHAVCDAEVVFENKDASGRWWVAGSGSPGVFVLQGLPRMLSTEKPEGEDMVDYRTFQLFKATANSLRLSAWTLTGAGLDSKTGLSELVR